MPPLSNHSPVRRVRRTAGVLLALLTVALGAPAIAGAAASFIAVLHAPNHTPIENKAWPITVVVTKGQTKLSGNVNYEFLYGGTIVSHQPGHSFKNGLFKDTLTFPGAAIGKALTLRVVVTTKYGTKDINWGVTTKA
jgi:hypothetical protein